MFILPFPVSLQQQQKVTEFSLFVFFHTVFSLSIFHTLSRSCPYLHSSHMRQPPPDASSRRPDGHGHARGRAARAAAGQPVAPTSPSRCRSPVKDTRGDRRCNHDSTHRVCAKIGTPTSFLSSLAKEWVPDKRRLRRCAWCQDALPSRKADVVHLQVGDCVAD